MLCLFLILVGCSSLMPQPDCEAVQNVNVQGTVLNSKTQPIANAAIHIESLKQNKCLNSEPIDDIDLTSSENGEFNTTIQIISEDDVLTFEVEAEGYSKYVYESIPYVYFSDELKIILYELQPTATTSG